MEDVVLRDISAQGVASVTLNRLDVHNAFDEHVIALLSHYFDDLAKRDDVRAVVLKGAGKSFSAGADLNWMKRAADYTPAQNAEDAMALANMLEKLYRLPQMTIALVQGAAFGGGFGLASACDVVMASQRAKFCLSEVKLGLIPATIAPYVMRAIGERQARRYFQTAELIDVAKAKEIGLVHEIYDDEAAMVGACEALLSEYIYKNAPMAMREAKKLVLDLAKEPVSQGLNKETAQRIADIRAGAEAKEGLNAFLEKRKANWIND